MKNETDKTSTPPTFSVMLFSLINLSRRVTTCPHEPRVRGDTRAIASEAT
mgnify:CR=1 FL=1